MQVGPLVTSVISAAIVGSGLTAARLIIVGAVLLITARPEAAVGVQVPRF